MALLGLMAGAQPVLNPSNGHYYEKKNFVVNWQRARDMAQQYEVNGYGGHLVTIKDATEEQFVYDLTGGQEGYWLGGYQDPKETNLALIKQMADAAGYRLVKKRN
jgi:hypothetical protein